MKTEEFTVVHILHTALRKRKSGSIQTDRNTRKYLCRPISFNKEKEYIKNHILLMGYECINR